MSITPQEIIQGIKSTIDIPSLTWPLIFLGILIFWIELNHRLRPSSPLKLKTCDWDITKTDYGIQVAGWIEISNPHSRMEVMVPELEIRPILLGKEGVNEINTRTSITTYHPDEDPRKDNYWQAYIIKSKKHTRAYVKLDLYDSDSLSSISIVENIWINIDWVNYGPFGRLEMQQGAVIPLQRPAPLTNKKAYFQQYKHFQLLPIKTHILGTNDDIIEVMSTYVSSIVKPGDVLTIGETPLAIMQGRYLHPSTVNPGFVSKLLCRGFHPTSSLATACGLQTLIDIVGPSRILLSFLIGLAGKCIGIKGLFYRIAGDQARLIDDITGTTPPYDQTIVLGPKEPRKICEMLSKILGINVAIVDVNDLGRVKILAASRNCKKAFLQKALRKNPAGNANEQTPLVLVRPC